VEAYRDVDMPASCDAKGQILSQGSQHHITQGVQGSQGCDLQDSVVETQETRGGCNPQLLPVLTSQVRRLVGRWVL
jgi:hypothetical protein